MKLLKDFWFGLHNYPYRVYEQILLRGRTL